MNIVLKNHRKTMNNAFLDLSLDQTKTNPLSKKINYVLIRLFSYFIYLDH